MNGFLPLLLCLLAGGVPGTPAEAPGAARRDFLVRCSSCHGREGRGDGPLAGELRTAPANLRRLSARHGGVFPETDVRRVLDGNRDVPAHGPSEMPVWGLSFQEPGRDAFDADHVRERLDGLVELLRSMQETDPPGRTRRRGAKRAR